LDIREVIDWLRRLVYLDIRVFDDIRTNPGATIPGVLIVLVASLLAGLGGWFWWLINYSDLKGDIFLHSAVLGSLIAVILWGLAWLGIVYVMLTQVFRQRAYVEQLLRVMGLAASPLALMLLMFIPGLSFAIGLASLGLTFGLTAVAIKSVTTADNAQILVANALGFFVWAAALSLLASSSAASIEPHAPGIFLYNAINSVAQDVLDFRP
jgi:hypothetical protein